MRKDTNMGKSVQNSLKIEPMTLKPIFVVFFRHESVVAGIHTEVTRFPPQKTQRHEDTEVTV